MNTNSVTFNINLNVSVQSPREIAALLSELQSAINVAVQAPEPEPALVPTFPAINPSCGAAFRKVAEKNLQQLEDRQIPEQGWGAVNNLPGVIAKLPAETRKVVLHAIENGGHLTREEVYEVLGRTEAQTLRGFTKPVMRLMKELEDTGIVDANAAPLLAPIYDNAQATFQQAQGFKVPVQVVYRLKVLAAAS